MSRATDSVRSGPARYSRNVLRDCRHRARAILGAKLPRGGFVRGVATLAGGTVLGQGAVIAASPILTRLYTPADFGVLAVYVSVIAPLAVVASLRYEYAIPLPKRDSEAAQLLVVALSIALVFPLVIAVVILTAGSALAEALGVPAFAPHLWLIPLGLFAVSVNQIFSFWAVRKQEYGRLARTKISKGFGSAATQLLLGALAAGPFGLLAGDVVGRSAGSVVLCRLAVHNDRGAFRGVTLARLRKRLVRYRHFPLLSAPASLLNSAGIHSPALLLAMLYGPQVAGLYGLSQRVVGAPMVLVGSAVANVFMGQATHLLRQRDPAIRGLFRKAAVRLLAIGLIPIPLLAVAGPYVFSRVFGAEWLEAGQFTSVLALMYLVQFVVVPLSQTLNVLERQRTQLAWDVSRFVLAALSIVIPFHLGAPPIAAVASLGVTLSLSYLVLFLLSWRALGQTMHFRQ